MEDLLSKLKTHVALKLAAMDGSHDLSHIERVHSLAVRIASEEGIAADSEDMFLVRAAALLHDVDDYKYSGSDDCAKATVAHILSVERVPASQAARIVGIIAAVSFHGELEGSASETLLSRIVQDADRLEAVGAIGIARCLMFAGARGRPLYDADCLSPAWQQDVLSRTLAMDEYQRLSHTSVGHFYAKLLRLKDMMKTAAGRLLAQHRHDVMVGFLSELFDDIGAAS